MCIYSSTCVYGHGHGHGHGHGYGHRFGNGHEHDTHGYTHGYTVQVQYAWVQYYSTVVEAWELP